MKAIYIGIVCLICIAAVKSDESKAAADPLANATSFKNETSENHPSSTAQLGNVSSTTQFQSSSKEYKSATYYSKKVTDNNSSKDSSKSFEAIKNFTDKLTGIGSNTSLNASVSSVQPTKVEMTTTNKSISRLTTFRAASTDAGNSKSVNTVSTGNLTSGKPKPVSDVEINSTLTASDSNNTSVNLTTKSIVSSSSKIPIGISMSPESPDGLTTTDKTANVPEISSKKPGGLITMSSKVPLDNKTSVLPNSSSENPEHINTSSSNTLSSRGTSPGRPEDTITTPPEAPLNISSSLLPRASSTRAEDFITTSLAPEYDRTSDLPEKPKASTSTKDKTSSIIAVTLFPSSEGGLLSNLDSEIPLPTFATAGSRALKLVVSITFLVVAVVATAVLLVYMIRIKRRAVLYEELRLLP